MTEKDYPFRELIIALLMMLIIKLAPGNRMGMIVLEHSIAMGNEIIALDNKPVAIKEIVEPQ